MSKNEELENKFSQRIDELSRVIDSEDNIDKLELFFDDVKDAYDLNKIFVEKIGKSYKENIDIIKSKLIFKIDQLKALEKNIYSDEDVLEEKFDYKGFNEELKDVSDRVLESKDQSRLEYLGKLVDGYIYKLVDFQNKGLVDSNLATLLKYRAVEIKEIAQERSIKFGKEENDEYKKVA